MKRRLALTVNVLQPQYADLLGPLYDAGMAALLVGVEAKSMTVLLNEHGGIFDFSYEIDVEHSGCGVNSYHVEIREA